MDVAALLQDLFGRTPPLAFAAVDGLRADQLTWAPEPGANSIGWLIWHLTRVQDHHVSELLDEEQIWTSDDRWAKRCGLEPDPHNTGYGHSADDVASVRPDSPPDHRFRMLARDSPSFPGADRRRRPCRDAVPGLGW